MHVLCTKQKHQQAYMNTLSLGLFGSKPAGTIKRGINLEKEQKNWKTVTVN